MSFSGSLTNAFAGINVRNASGIATSALAAAAVKQLPVVARVLGFAGEMSKFPRGEREREKDKKESTIRFPWPVAPSPLVANLAT